MTRPSTTNTLLLTFKFDLRIHSIDA